MQKWVISAGHFKQDCPDLTGNWKQGPGNIGRRNHSTTQEGNKIPAVNQMEYFTLSDKTRVEHQCFSQK